MEATAKTLRGLADKRKKIEQHDSRHAEVISRTGSAAIVAEPMGKFSFWYFGDNSLEKIFVASKMYMNWIYYNNLLGVGIECAIARIMELDKITAADIGVYAMVIEDAIGFLLTRFREANGTREANWIQVSLAFEWLRRLRVKKDNVPVRHLKEW